MRYESIRAGDGEDSDRVRQSTGRFYVRAGSVNSVRRALLRAPGGGRVIGRHDRETIECGHSMSDRSLARHWPVIASRLECSGLVVVARPEAAASAGTEANE